METEKKYSDFVKEAFIDPIRSVLIVDDDYPTYAEILSPNCGADSDIHKQKAWRQNPNLVSRVIQNFRARNPSLSVDIHDEVKILTDERENMAKHLHQCDLLVLDFQLDRTQPQDGTSAIKILRSVMSNNHFNLVVVHSQEDPDWVFESVLWGLLEPEPDQINDQEIEDAKELIYEGESQSQGFETKITKSIGSSQYFSSRADNSFVENMSQGLTPYKDFKDITDQVNWNENQCKTVLLYLLKEVENKHKESMYRGTKHLGELTWVSDTSGGKKRWIKSDSVFVVFSKKSNEGDLFSELEEALIQWGPRPSRMIQTRIRAEMDEHGIAVQGRALSNYHAQAYWYHQLLSTKDAESRRWRVAENVSRHADQLMQSIIPHVEEFTEQLIEAELKSNTPDQICKQRYQVDLNDRQQKNRAALEHNAYVSTMEPTGWHLTIGHIFLMSDELWLSLSAACDMQPRIPSWRQEVTGNRMQFIGIKLCKVENEFPKEVTSNRHIFLQRENGVEIYCFNQEKSNSPPHWHVLFAENRGLFSSTDFQFKVSRIRPGKTKLIFDRHNAQVVGQLRYEYALNLLQKLGTTLTRVGLEFVDGKIG